MNEINTWENEGGAQPTTLHSIDALKRLTRALIKCFEELTRAFQPAIQAVQDFTIKFKETDPEGWKAFWDAQRIERRLQASLAKQNKGEKQC